MNIIFLTQLYPNPKDSGSKIISDEILNILIHKQYVYFFSFIEEINYRINQYKLIPKIKYKYIEKKSIIFKKHPYSIAFKLLLSIVSILPYVVKKYASNKMRFKVEESIINENIDKIFVCNDTMMQYIPSWFKGKVIYTVVDLSSTLYEQYAKYENNIFKKIILLWESYKLKQYENKILHRADIIFSISHTELEKIKTTVGPKKIVRFLPIPFELHKRNLNINDPNILFIGSLTWRPNYDGLWWFLKEIFPSVIKAIPKAKLFVGSNDDFSLGNYKYRNNVFLIRNVIHNNSISNDLYAKSKVFIVPIRFGSGIRIKLLDALSHGIPVASTTKGADGIGITNKEILITDQPDSFAQNVINVLNNRQFAFNLSKNSQKFIKKKFNQMLAQKVIQTNIHPGY